MQYLRGIYDSSSQRLMVEYKNVLLERQWDLFSGMIKHAKKSRELPNDTEIKKIDSEKALIMIPCVIEGAEKYNDGERIKNLPNLITEKLSSLLENFAKVAMESEMSMLEFMPLSGYPISKLKEDLDAAIKDKRDLVLIDTYKNYQKLINLETIESNQLRLKFIDNDYADVAYLIHSGDIQGLKKYKSKLKLNSWV